MSKPALPSLESVAPIDFAIVGGGILGLAVAIELSRSSPGREIHLLEKESDVARHQTGHNSGVIHSGIYYAPGTAKARHCVDGAKLMKRFCADAGVPARDVGKLVVATSVAEERRLDELMRRGLANGVSGVELIGAERMREIEPHVTGLRALWVPGAGIVDYGDVARRLAFQARERGVVIRTATELRGIDERDDHLVLATTRGRVVVRQLVNCAGLHADRVARCAPSVDVPLRIVPFRGEYYQLAPERCELVRGLVYPVPDPALPFLGVHFTARIDGGVDCGPNAVLALHREGYRKGMVRARDLWELGTYPGVWRMAGRNLRAGLRESWRSYSKRRFVRDLQRLIPAVRGADLRRRSSGVRAQAVRPDGTLLDDFALVRTQRALHVCNAPSPAATASLSIARAIVDALRAGGDHSKQK